MIWIKIVDHYDIVVDWEKKNNNGSWMIIYIYEYDDNHDSIYVFIRTTHLFEIWFINNLFSIPNFSSFFLKFKQKQKKINK